MLAFPFEIVIGIYSKIDFCNDKMHPRLLVPRTLKLNSSDTVKEASDD